MILELFWGSVRPADLRHVGRVILYKGSANKVRLCVGMSKPQGEFCVVYLLTINVSNNSFILSLFKAILPADS